MKRLLPVLMFSSVFMFTACSDSDNATSSSQMTSNSPDSVLTGNLLKDSRDGQTYRTVTIGSQTWMAENLNFETANSFCYNDSAKYCAKYGRLYTWAAAKKACPTGWHLPTKGEFETLLTAVGGQSTAGKMLKSTSGWDDGGNGTDDYSFSALPAGGRFDDGIYDSEGIRADFWSSTESGNGLVFIEEHMYTMFLYYSLDDANLYGDTKSDGFSIRCVKD